MNEERRPRILISVGKDPGQYGEALEAAGGEAVPVYGPEPEPGYDGLILAGGPDLEPALYGQPVREAVNMDPRRDRAELALIRAFLREQKPVFGICRGFQLLNVYFGGSLRQNLPNADCHTTWGHGSIDHRIRALGPGFLRELYGEEISVNSYHHQGVDRLGADLIPLAVAEDGRTLEAFVHRSLPVLGVQFHPERMCSPEQRGSAADGSLLFRYFVSLCTGETGNP